MLDIANITESQIEAIWPRLNAQQKDVFATELSKLATVKKCAFDDSSASFSEWAMSWFYVPETKAPIYLYPHQRKAIDMATARDADGLFKYSLVHYGDIKKSGKTTIAAMIALRFAFLKEWSSIKVVGQKLDQAKSRSYFYIRRALDLNPVFAQMQEEGRIIVSNYTIRFMDNNSIIQAIPASPSTEAGGNDDCIIWTEIGSAKTQAAQQLWSELVIPPRKYGYGIKWVEGYAGSIGESPILENIYEANVKEEYKVDDDPPMYSNNRTFVMWNDRPRLKRFQTPEYYRQQAAELRESEFLRIHRNQWVSSENVFIDSVAIDLCYDPKMPVLKNKEKMIVAIDAAYAEGGDYFAIVAVTKHPTDKSKKVAQRLSKTWRADKNGMLQFKNAKNPLDTQYPFGYVIQLAKQYNVVCMVYDPFQMHLFATELSQMRISWMRDFNQKALRELADNDLYKLIRDKEIAIADSEVITHLKNANANEKGRLVKRNQSAKIDLAVALSMAAFTATDGKTRL